MVVLTRTRRFPCILGLLKALQKIKVSSPAESSTILVNNKTSFLKDHSDLNLSQNLSVSKSWFAEDSLYNFKQYIKMRNNCVGQVLAMTDFWVFLLNQFLSNFESGDFASMVRPKTLDRSDSRLRVRKSQPTKRHHKELENQRKSYLGLHTTYNPMFQTMQPGARTEGYKNHTIHCASREFIYGIDSKATFGLNNQ
jgi:hypothetical protein